MTDFQIIQGGMGVAVSGWRLANAVSRQGQLGVVSGTGLAVVMARRLQEGDRDGLIRRALEHYPYREAAEATLKRYYIPNGKADNVPFDRLPMPGVHASQRMEQLVVMANFVEVFLAKEGHTGKVGINYLEKIQFLTLPALFGAMLAGVDYVIMGAGIPRSIPGILDRLAQGLEVEQRIDVIDDADGEPVSTRFTPETFCQGQAPSLRRPKFLAIIASNTLATTLIRKSNGKVDGLIIEGPTAGGHNAPPRGRASLNKRNEPVYGERDEVDLEKIRKLNIPFWLAGGFASHDKLNNALAKGAQGIQIGTAFAYCEESGIADTLKHEVIRRSRDNRIEVITDPLASPTGFPFKVVQLDDTIASPAVAKSRQRICDLGYLRRAYRKSDGTLGYRCPAEPTEAFLTKGGTAEEAVNRKCICNGLFSTIDLPQITATGQREPALVTAGNDICDIWKFTSDDRDSYTAADVLSAVLEHSR